MDLSKLTCVAMLLVERPLTQRADLGRVLFLASTSEIYGVPTTDYTASVTVDCISTPSTCQNRHAPIVSCEETMKAHSSPTGCSICCPSGKEYWGAI